MGEQSANDNPAVAIVAANFGIGADAGWEVASVLECEVDRGGEGLIDVAGGAELLADDDAVGLA